VQDVFRLLRKLADQSTTALMVEQSHRSALKICDEAIALELGRLVMPPPTSELLTDPHLERLFLGGAPGRGGARCYLSRRDGYSTQTPAVGTGAPLGSSTAACICCSAWLRNAVGLTPKCLRKKRLK